MYKRQVQPDNLQTSKGRVVRQEKKQRQCANETRRVEGVKLNVYIHRCVNCVSEYKAGLV